MFIFMRMFNVNDDANPAGRSSCVGVFIALRLRWSRVAVVVVAVRRVYSNLHELRAQRAMFVQSTSKPLNLTCLQCEQTRISAHTVYRHHLGCCCQRSRLFVVVHNNIYMSAKIRALTKVAAHNSIPCMHLHLTILRCTNLGPTTCMQLNLIFNQNAILLYGVYLLCAAVTTQTQTNNRSSTSATPRVVQSANGKGAGVIGCPRAFESKSCSHNLN